jgi:hypothetical protein
MIFLILILLISHIYVAATNRNSTSKDISKVDDFKILGIYLGQPITEALSILGKPLKVEETDKDNNIEKYFYFPQIMIGNFRVSKRVAYIWIEKSGVKTFRGIEVGSSEKDVMYRYGNVRKVQNMLSYEKDDKEAFGIAFFINKGKVKNIPISILSN